jgi:hypothetical protein
MIAIVQYEAGKYSGKVAVNCDGINDDAGIIAKARRILRQSIRDYDLISGAFFIMKKIH